MNYATQIIKDQRERRAKVKFVCCENSAKRLKQELAESDARDEENYQNCNKRKIATALQPIWEK